MNYTFYFVLQLYETGSTLHQYSDQAPALKSYQKYSHAILYELVVGDTPSLREALRKEPGEESEASQ